MSDESLGKAEVQTDFDTLGPERGLPFCPKCGDEFWTDEGCLFCPCEDTPRYDNAPAEPWEGNGPCQECGARNVVWATTSETWDRVMHGPKGTVCPMCFIKRAWDEGILSAWRIEPWEAIEDKLAVADFAEALFKIGALDNLTMGEIRFADVVARVVGGDDG
jgi:hypothetical protein